MFQSLTQSFMGLFSDENRAVGYNEAITVVMALVFPLAATISLTSGAWLPLSIPGATAQTRSLALPLAAILAWLIAALALGETFRAIYYREKSLWFPSVARVCGDLLVMGFAVSAGRQRSLLLAAWGLIAGVGLETLLEFAGLPVLLHSHFRPAWPSAARRQEMLDIVGEPLAGHGVQVLAGVGQRALASLLPPGSITAVSYASRIISTLERFVFRGFTVTTIQMRPSEDGAELYPRFRLLAVIGIALSAALLALSRPLVAIAFGHGHFVTENVLSLAVALQAYAPVILGQAMTRIPLGLAYAQKRGRVVFDFLAGVSVVILAAQAALVYLGLGLRAFGLGHSLAIALVGAWFLGAVLPATWRRAWLRRDGPRLGWMALGAWGSTALAAAVVGRLATGHWYSDWISVAVGALSCCLSILGAAYALQVEEAKQVLGWIAGRLHQQTKENTGTPSRFGGKGKRGS
jgi:peptidoglycan biosynthesis protein MviN/MurJ (putative lipid II flippase)